MDEQTAPTTTTGLVHALLTGVQRAIADAEAHLADLRTEERGLMLTARRLGLTVDSVPTRPPDGPVGHATVSPPTLATRGGVSGPMPPGAPAPMTDLVEQVLSTADRPLSPRDIAERLTAMGHPQENTEAVRGALAYMKRRKPARARDIARSKWVLPGGPHDVDLMFTPVLGRPMVIEAKTSTRQDFAVPAHDMLTPAEDTSHGPSGPTNQGTSADVAEVPEVHVQNAEEVILDDEATR